MLLRSAVTLALFFTVTGCSRAPEPVVAKPAETAAANPPVPAAAPPPAPTEEPPVPAAQFGPSMAWQVRTVPNPDDGTEVVVGALDAQDTIATRTGPQKPSLLLRCIGGKPDIVIATHAMAQTVPDGSSVSAFGTTSGVAGVPKRNGCWRHANRRITNRSCLPTWAANSRSSPPRRRFTSPLPGYREKTLLSRSASAATKKPGPL